MRMQKPRSATASKRDGIALSERACEFSDVPLDPRKQARWRSFADAHRMKIHQGHGSDWSVSGTVEGLDLSASERPEGEGVELAAVGLLDPSLSFVVLDARFEILAGDIGVLTSSQLTALAASAQRSVAKARCRAGDLSRGSSASRT
jgi:hypothetical protein